MAHSVGNAYGVKTCVQYKRVRNFFIASGAIPITYERYHTQQYSQFRVRSGLGSGLGYAVRAHHATSAPPAAAPPTSYMVEVRRCDAYLSPLELDRAAAGIRSRSGRWHCASPRSPRSSSMMQDASFRAKRAIHGTAATNTPAGAAAAAALCEQASRQVRVTTGATSPIRVRDSHPMEARRFFPPPLAPVDAPAAVSVWSRTYSCARACEDTKSHSSTSSAAARSTSGSFG